MSSRIFHDDAANHIAGLVEFAHSEHVKEIFGAASAASWKFFRAKQFFSAEKIFTKKIIPSKRRDFFCKDELKNIS